MTREIPPFLLADIPLYAGFIQLYLRDTVRPLEESDRGVFIQDAKGVSYMLAADDPDLAAAWLERHRDRRYDLVMAVGEDIAARVREKLGFTDTIEVYQALYTKQEPPEIDRRLRLVPAGPADMGFIRQHYSFLDDEELEQVIHHRELYLAFDGEEPVGFIGQHLEGSMGLLEILPAFRRRGLGAELECFMIGKMLDQGLLPYCQFETDNLASRRLQEKLGLTVVDKKKIVWLF